MTRPPPRTTPFPFPPLFRSHQTPTNFTIAGADVNSINYGFNPPPNSADLAITKTGSANPVKAGQQLTYTITVTNSGPSTATKPFMSDTLDTNTTFVSLAAPANWNCTTPLLNMTGTINCTDTIDMPANGTAPTFTLKVKLGPKVPDQT